MKSAYMRHIEVGKDGGTKFRHVDDLLIVISGRAGIVRPSLQERGAAGEAEPAVQLALRGEFYAVVRFVALRDELDVTLRVGDLWIEKRSVHLKESASEQNAPTELIFCTGFELTGEIGREKGIGIDVGPEGGLQAQGERDAVIDVGHQALNGPVGNRILRKPDGLAGVKKVVQRVILTADVYIDALGQTNMVGDYARHIGECLPPGKQDRAHQKTRGK